MSDRASEKPDGSARPPRGGVLYKFGPFRLDPAERVLKKGGDAVPLTPKAFDTLLLLVRNGGHLLGKSELMDAVWPDIFVEEKTLAQNVFILRRALGTDEEGRQYIETVPKRGYRFRAAVEAVPAAEDGAAVQSEADSASSGEEAAGPKSEAKGTAEKETAEGDAEADAAASGQAYVETRADAERARAGAEGESVSLRSRAMRRAALASLLAAACIGTALWAARDYFRPVRPPLVDAALRRISATRFTDTGNIAALDLSRDGRYVAYAAKKGDTQSLFIRHVGATSAVEILPPAPVEYRGLTFSHDGAWLFYVVGDKGSVIGVLRRMPALGGVSVELVRDVDSPVTLSPEGDRLAFMRFLPESQQAALVVAGADGTGERVLALRDAADGFSHGGPSWSPDGRFIASGTFNYTGDRSDQSILVVSVADGSVRALGEGGWSWVGRMAWLADGSGVLFTSGDSESDILSDQVWVMSYPEGRARRITYGITSFQSLGSSADGRTLAVMRQEIVSGLWVARGGDWARAERITYGFGDPGSRWLGLAWAPGARLVYAAGRDGRQSLWVISSDGTGRRQLTHDLGTTFSPVASPDGRFIVFVSHRDGARRLWRVDADGRNPTPLTNSEGDDSPSFTPDGRWVVYATRAGGKQTVWRVSIEGGEPVQLTRAASLLPSVSPGGALVACALEDEATGDLTASLISFEDGRVVRRFKQPFPVNSPALRWTPDGRFITYVVTRGGVSNIWAQPADGGEARQLTAWTADLIYRFDWSKDGTLACERGAPVNDVVVIRDAGGD